MRLRRESYETKTTNAGRVGRKPTTDGRRHVPDGALFDNGNGSLRGFPRIKHDSSVHCDALMSLPKSALTDFVGRLLAPRLVELHEALRVALDVE